MPDAMSSGPRRRRAIHPSGSIAGVSVTRPVYERDQAASDAHGRLLARGP